jgi:ligand-binding sensor domain-containing protein/DNA-binding CsgD family transcriptional regulator
MQKTVAFLLLLYLNICFSIIYGQIKNIGLPFIHNYSKNEYKAGSQTWDMVEDKQGLLYFANNNGILEFDGVNWKIYQTPNQSVVRSVSIGEDQTIYAGAYNEFGYLKRNANGKLSYQSLVDLLPAECQNFDEIWKIYQTTFGIVFQSFNYIFIYHEGKISVIKPYSRFGFSFYVNGVYYVVDKEQGILNFSRGVLTKVANQPDVLLEDEIRFMLPFTNNSILVGILNHGLYILENGIMRSWDSPINSLILRNHFFSGIQVQNGYYAFGTISNGFFIADKNGIVLQHINRTHGLQNNTVLSLYTDKLGNIWSGLDNGISYTEISSPATLLNHCFGIETGYVSLIHRDILYLGTNQGLFAREVNKLSNNPVDDNSFTLIDGTQGQVWTLFRTGNTLLCGHNNGTFLIDGYNAVKISPIRGVWKFIQRNNKPGELLAGTYTGIIAFRNMGLGDEKWVFSHSIKGFSESSKDILEDTDGSLLISHGYNGIYRLKLSENADSVVDSRLYTQSSGLPEQLPYEIHSIFNKTVVTTNKGCYEFNSNTGKFAASERFNTFFGDNKAIFKTFVDSTQNIWYTSANKMGVYRLLEDGNYREVSTPFYRFSDNLVPAFEHIYPYNEHNVFIGVQNGFIHYDPTIVKRYNDSYPVYIREIKFLKKYTDSIISYHGDIQNSKYGTYQNINIPYIANSLSFIYASPFFESSDKTEYRCRLKGYSTEWSPWEMRTIREYTNLHEGTYTFEVQARNIYKTISNSDSFTFEVSPPFYRSILAYIIYVILFISAVIANIFYFKRRIQRTRQKDEIIHKRKLLEKEQQYREESLIAEKEIEHLKNDQLLLEMKHKNKELANSTMNIIHKNKFLNTLKDELNDITVTASDNNKSRIKQLLRKIDRDISNEKNFKVFDSYFDDVHQDFLNRLKEKYPVLSPKELRLCAYIRMNISSKEIASLLNISLRGVEVSRYRLRKKMMLEREINLTEYILNF